MGFSILLLLGTFRLSARQELRSPGLAGNGLPAPFTEPERIKLNPEHVLTQLSVDQVTVSLLTYPEEVQNCWRLPFPGARAREHRSTRSHTHTHTHTREHRSSLSHTHTLMHTHSLMRAQKLLHIHESTEALTHAHTSTEAHSLTHTHTHTHTRAQKLSRAHTREHRSSLSITHTHTHMHTPHFLLGPATDRCLGPRWLDRLGQMAAWGWQPGPDPGLLSPDPPIPSVTCFRAAGGSSWDGCLCALGSFQGPARPLPEPHCPPPPVPARSLALVHCGAWQVLLGTSARPAPCLWSRPVCLSALLSP